MLFPDIAPSKAKVQREVTDALRAPNLCLYVDSSVLIHCYEMSRSACEELLAALDGFGQKVRVPVWCAKETWEHTRSPGSRKPLQKMAGQLTKKLGDLKTHSLRYVDERTFEDLTVDAYSKSLEDAVELVGKLTRRVQKIEPSHDAASARLWPFIAERAINSDMVQIYSEVQATGEARFSHGVPPGFGDGGNRAQPEGEEEVEDPAPKGKKRNRHGDLIVWLEILADCRDRHGEHLVVLTRDTTKSDWAHNPERVLGDNGQLTTNGGVITLPLPMLVQEAKRRCTTIETVNVVTLELFVQVMRSSFRARLSNLARALQAAAKPSGTTGPVDRQEDTPRQDSDDLTTLTFTSEDMVFEPSPQERSRPIWQVLEDLKAEGWTIQNDAASRLPDLLTNATENELKQIGRGLLDAANEDALGPVAMAVDLVLNDPIPVRTRANIIVGLLAETYFSDDREPKKPVANTDIVEALFEAGNDPKFKQAYDITVGARLAPVRRAYLALPGEEAVPIRVQIVVNQGSLMSIQANDKELLEHNVPEGRRRSPIEGTMSVSDLIAAVAQEFVVPVERLTVDGPTNFDVAIPERTGFISWGPSTGEQLR